MAPLLNDLPRDNLVLIAAAMRELVREHQDGWVRKADDRRIFDICEPGFAFMRMSMTCKLWSTLIHDAWSAKPNLINAFALKKISAEMQLSSGVFDEANDEASGEDSDEDSPSWRRAECALLVGFSTSYTALRESLCTGRRFWYGGADGEVSNLMSDDPPMPEDGRTFGLTEIPNVDAIRDGSAWVKYRMPERVSEISRLLKARGGLLDLKCFCTGGMSSAGETVVVGYKIGDVHWRHARALLGDLEDLEGAVGDSDFSDDDMFGHREGPFAHECFFPLDDEHEEFLAPFAPVHKACFIEALEPLFGELLADFWEEAKPQYGTLHKKARMRKPQFFLGGQAGDQSSLKYQLAMAEKEKKERLAAATSPPSKDEDE